MMENASQQLIEEGKWDGGEAFPTFPQRRLLLVECSVPSQYSWCEDEEAGKEGAFDDHYRL